MIVKGRIRQRLKAEASVHYDSGSSSTFNIVSYTMGYKITVNIAVVTKAAVNIKDTVRLYSLGTGFKFARFKIRNIHL